MSQFNQPASPEVVAAPVSPPRAGDPKSRIVDALMELAAERRWDDITLSDIALRASLSLADFRDHFPSKGAVLGAFARRIDRIVLDGTTADLGGESAKERLFDVLMRRIDALKPYRDALQSISDWARGDLLGSAALNGVMVNSMRFMLEAAGIDSEGPVGTLKLQGLAMAWNRVLDTWFEDDDPDLGDHGRARPRADARRPACRAGGRPGPLDRADPRRRARASRQPSYLASAAARALQRSPRARLGPARRDRRRSGDLRKATSMAD